MFNCIDDIINEHNGSEGVYAMTEQKINSDSKDDLSLVECSSLPDCGSSWMPRCNIFETTQGNSRGTVGQPSSLLVDDLSLFEILSISVEENPTISMVGWFFGILCGAAIVGKLEAPHTLQREQPAPVRCARRLVRERLTTQRR